MDNSLQPESLAESLIENKGKQDKTEELPTWLRYVKNHGLVALGSVFVTVIVMSGKVADSIGKIKAFVHPGPTPLELVEEDAKSKFSKGLAQEAWERLYRLRTYAFKVGRGASQADLDAAWQQCSDIAVQWNRNLMPNYQALDDYYPGSGKAAQLLNELQPEFDAAQDELRDLQYPPKRKKLTDKEIEDQLQQFDKTIDKLNSDLFVFVTTQTKEQLQSKR